MRDEQEKGELAGEAANASRRRLLKAAGMALGIVGLILAVHLSPLRSLLQDVQAAKQWIRSFGPLAGVVFAVAGTLMVASGLPRSLVSIAGGTIFGFVQGFLWSHLASVAAVYAVFRVGRAVGAKHLGHWLEVRGGKLSMLTREVGWLEVVLARQLPLHGLVLSLSLSVGKTRDAAYLVGSAIGMLPISILMAALGAGLGKETLGASLLPVLSGALVAVCGAALGWRYLRRKRASSGQTSV